MAQNAFVDPLRRLASWFDEVACHKIVTPNLHSFGRSKYFANRGALWPIRPLISVSLLARALPYSFKAGEIIFRHGDPAEELYIVKSGKVEIRLGNRLLDTLPELSIFGEMALIDHSPRSATVVAATDATIVPVDEKQFLFLVSRTPHFALNVMRVLAQRLRTTNSVVY